MMKHFFLFGLVALSTACQPVSTGTGGSDASSAEQASVRSVSPIKVSCKPFEESAGIMNKGERSSIEGSMNVSEVVKNTRNHVVYKVDAVLKVTLLDKNKTEFLSKEVAVRGTYEKIKGGLFGESFEYAIFQDLSDTSLKEIKIDLQKKNMGWVDHRGHSISYMTNCKQ